LSSEPAWDTFVGTSWNRSSKSLTQNFFLTQIFFSRAEKSPTHRFRHLLQQIKPRRLEKSHADWLIDWSIDWSIDCQSYLFHLKETQCSSSMFWFINDSSDLPSWLPCVFSVHSYYTIVSSVQQAVYLQKWINKCIPWQFAKLIGRWTAWTKFDWEYYEKKQD
jgi:hypothetical protein